MTERLQEIIILIPLHQHAYTVFETGDDQDHTFMDNSDLYPSLLRSISLQRRLFTRYSPRNMLTFPNSKGLSIHQT